MNARTTLALFCLLVVGGGSMIGFLTVTGPWYRELLKPSFNPPNWVFGPVWTVLYVAIAFVGWRTWQKDARGWTMRLWFGQLVLNFLWSPVFFGARRIDFAFYIVLVMLAVILAFIAASWRQDRLSAYLFGPYASWVVFASVLNGAIYVLN